MEAASKCSVYHTDADALLPPRKRLLAGLKRQNSDVNRPAPSTSQYESHLNSLWKAKLNDPNLSNDEIVEISRSAAIEAATVAEAARAKAEVKALKAASAMAAAKNALDLVATLSNREKLSRRNKLKKQATVEALYNKNKGNSSPRMLKNTSGSDLMNQKHKKLKSSASSSGGGAIQNAAPLADDNSPSQALTHGMTLGYNSEALAKEIDIAMVDLITTKTNIDSALSLVDQERQPINTDQSKLEICVLVDKPTKSCDTCGKKKGRLKQKRLPLSICNFRDQTTHREDETKVPHATQHFEEDTTKEPLFPPETPAKSWKCQAIKVTPCVTQNKLNL